MIKPSSGVAPRPRRRAASPAALGAGQPMGPLGLLDFVGLDVSQAIGETIGATVPAKLRELVAEGSLGRKSGQGFYSYE